MMVVVVDVTLGNVGVVCSQTERERERERERIKNNIECVVK